MRYEDWIKYENLRHHQAGCLAWISLPDEASKNKKSPLSKQTDKPPVWTMVIQIFNSRRI
jgi:hypothetical protein